MRYLALGPLELRDGDRAVPLAKKVRVLLAILLVNADRVVSIDRIAGELYGEHPPPSLAKLVQIYVSKLRRALDDRGADVLVTRPTGYQLVVKEDEYDVYRFEALAAQGLEALKAGASELAADRLDEALKLWRGNVFADIPRSGAIEVESVRLEEVRLATREAWVDARLRLGQHGELIGALRSNVIEHPTRERSRSQLMRALAATGRRAEALAEYTAGRDYLVSELGVEPGAELRAVHAAILADDDANTDRPPDRRDPVCQLPPATADLVGRQAIARQLRDVLRACPVVVISGQPGVGKSSLAVHVAHALRAAFPDGQLYVDLDPEVDGPAVPGELLADLLCAHGIPRASIPAGTAQRASLWRELFASRRILLLLDNVTDERQVRPLLLGTRGSAVLVTSTRRLAGLEGATNVYLPELSPAHGLELLSRLAGKARVGGEKAAARRIVELCGGLPLALRIVGTRLAARPDWSVAELATELRYRGLDALTVADMAVRSSIARTELALDDLTRRAFRRLAMLDTDSLPGWACGPLLDKAGEVPPYHPVEQLIDHHLLRPIPIQVHEPARYALPELISRYGRERAADEESVDDRRAALHRLCANYLGMAQLAEQRLSSSVLITGTSTPPPHLPDRVVHELLRDPFAWLESERQTMVRLIDQAAAAGLGSEAVGLALALGPYFESSGHIRDWRRSHRTALAAARATGDRRGAANLMRNVGELNTIQDRYDEAIVCYLASLEAFREVGDVAGEAAVQSGLGVVHRLRGRHDLATKHLVSGARLSASLLNSAGEAYARCQIGAVCLERGDKTAARRQFTQALGLAHKDGYRPGVATALRCLGLVEMSSGRRQAAARRFAASVAVCTQLGDRASEWHGRMWLGHLAMLRGDHIVAADTLRECLVSYQQHGQLFGQAMALRSLGMLHLRTANTDRALEDVRAALDIWGRIRSPYWTARTLDTLVEVHGRLGQSEETAAAAKQAVRLRTGIGLA